MQLRTTICAAILALATTTAGAQSPLTLTCTGTVKDNILDFVEKVQTGVIVNFQTRQIIGLLGGWDARIDSVDDTTVRFSNVSGGAPSPDLTHGGSGVIDRITGSLTANIYAWWHGTEPLTDYTVDLICKPARRLF
jgi:hypothetical protein